MDAVDPRDMGTDELKAEWERRFPNEMMPRFRKEQIERLSPAVEVLENIQVMMSRWNDMEKAYKDRLDRQFKHIDELLRVRKQLIDMIETLFQLVEPDGFRERLERIKNREEV